MPILLLYSKKLISPNVDLICSFQYRQMHWNWITARYWILFTKTSQQVNEYNAIFNRFSAGTKSHWRWNNPGYCRKPRALLMKFSTNHESLSQPIMKIGYWLHYFFHFSFCLTIVLGRIKFDCTLEDLHPVCQRKWFALEHSILSHLLWIARVAKSVLSRANLLPIL